jgi:cell division protein FtsL
MTPPAAAAAPAVRRARTISPGRPLTTAPRPRRVSGPARRSQSRPAQLDGGLALGALAALRSVEGHPLLDRLIRGRAWIVLVAFALIGIVTLQLGLLELNAGIGRSLAQEQSLQRENAALSIENSELAAGNRVEASAAHLGMQIVPIGSLKSLTPNPGVDVARALSVLSAASHTAGSSSTEVSTSASTASEQAASAPAGEQQPSEATTTATAESSGGEASAAPASTSESSAASSAPTSAATTPTTAPQTPVAGSAGSSASAEASPAGGTQAGPTG